MLNSYSRIAEAPQLLMLPAMFFVPAPPWHIPRLSVLFLYSPYTTTECGLE